MKKFILSALAVAAMVAPAANAVPIQGTGSVGFVGVTSAPAGSISTGTTFTFINTAFGGGSGDLAIVPLGSPMTASPITATVATPVSFSASWGSFSGFVTGANSGGPPSNRTVDIFALGIFTPAAGTPDLSMYSPGPMSLTFAATQTGGPTGVVSASYTFASPPARVPEPGSLALLGLGLVGLGAARRRKAD